MDIEYYGANCVSIKNKAINIVVDPTSNASIKKTSSTETIILSTMGELINLQQDEFVIDMPGEYEHNNVSVKGIPVHRHTDESGQNGTMYRISLDGVRIAVIGHTDAPIEDDDLEELGIIDVVIIPVGGNGYTLDARDAITIVRQISPTAVIPTHYDDGKTQYEIPQEKVDQFIKDMSGQHEKATALKLKTVSSLPDALTVFELARSN